MWRPIETAPSNTVCYFQFVQKSAPIPRRIQSIPFLGTLEEMPMDLLPVNWKPYNGTGN